METPREQLKKHLQDNIDFDGEQLNTLNSVYNQCIREYGFNSNYKRYGKGPNLVTEWLRGLPSCISFDWAKYMPYSTYHIGNLMYALGYDVLKEDDPDADSLYWSELGVIIYENR